MADRHGGGGRGGGGRGGGRGPGHGGGGGDRGGGGDGPGRGPRGGGGGSRGGGGGGGGDGPRGGRGGGGGFDRGGSRGGFGGRGGGGGRDGTVTYKQGFLPQNERPLTEENKNLGQQGWKLAELPEKKEDFVLPKRINGDKELRSTKRVITLRTNHFDVKITLPPFFYQYEVSLERRIEPGSEQKKPLKKTERKPQKGRGAGEEPNAGPPRFPKDIRRRILQRAVEKMTNAYPGGKVGIICDFGVEVWSTEKLEKKIPFEYEINISEIFNYDAEFEGTGSFIVKLKSTEGVIDTGPFQKAINDLRGMPQEGVFVEIKKVYNTLLKNMANSNYTLTGRSNLIRRPPNGQDGAPLGQGLVCWDGISSLFEFGWKAYINFDMANSVFVLGRSVFDAIDDLFATERFNHSTKQAEKQWGREDPRDIRKNWDRRTSSRVLELLGTRKVKYSPSKGKWLAGGITDVLGSVSEEKFMWDKKNKRVSVYDYYKEEHGTTLQHKNGLCLQIRNRNQVPAELCIIKSGQSYNRKLGAEQTTKMLGVAKKNPDELKDFIEKHMKSLLEKTREQGLLNAFGVTNPSQMLKLENTYARVLDAPTLCYGANQQGQKALMDPNEGVWDIWSHDFQFYKNATIKKMAVYAIDNRTEKGAILDFLKLIQDSARKRSANFPNPNEIVIEGKNLRDNEHQSNVETFTRQFTQIKENFKVSADDLKFCFILVILPRKPSKFYDQVKQAAELNLGILTQCIVAKNLQERNLAKANSIAGNVMLKLNSKLRGTNHVPIFPDKFKAVDILRYPVLILGADVTHPPPGSGLKASFAAVTGSLDRTGMPYMMHIQAQMKAERGAAEVIHNLTEIVFKMLIEFRRYSGNVIPAKIIYFRDGVGEGQFKELLHVELRQIRAACSKLPGDYKPKITFITVQKRHRTRFFMEVGGQISDKNCPPGTVVDSHIVHPVETDFYLLSHRGLLGTSRPTRYHVLWDDSDFKCEEIQTLAYFLCYMFVRCNRSVKIPAPTYYSHWAAQRAKVLTEQLVFPEDQRYFNPQTNLYNDQVFVNDLNSHLNGANLKKIMRDNPMHFV